MTPMPPKPKPDFAAVHARLKAIMQRYEQGSLKASPDYRRLNS
jgi:hypothetical protein